MDETAAANNITAAQAESGAPNPELLDERFGNTEPMGGIPDNPQAAIPGYYVKLNKGMTHEEILAEHLAAGGSGSGTSIFDPVLCELAYRWFSPPAGQVLDPFAGGSVRGVVASRLGRNYTGIDLSGVQISANEHQAARICSECMPRWIVGDAVDVSSLAPNYYDFVFSCPPYHDLEQYSDDPRDLSAQTWEKFLENYRTIIARCCYMLREDRFACFVVGDIRGPDGCYRQLPEETIRAFTDCGLKKYNEMILVTAVGSLGIRVGKQFGDYRKVGKTHQNVLVFLKGDWRKASAAVGPVDIAAEPMDFGELIPGQQPADQGANLRLDPGQYIDLPAGFAPAQVADFLPADTAETITAGLADGSLRCEPEFDGSGRITAVSICANDGTELLSGPEMSELMKKSAARERKELSHMPNPAADMIHATRPIERPDQIRKFPDEQITTADFNHITGTLHTRIPGGLGGEV